MNAKTVIAFIAGVTIGSLVTWKFVETKYKHIADEEIKSVVEQFNARQNGCDETEPVEEKPWRVEKPDIMEYAAKIKEARYALDLHDAKNEKEEGGDESMDSDKPYVISPEEFDELDDYEIRSFTYYEDGILTDEENHIVENVDELVGKDSLDTFGYYEQDSVFVRNDALKTDFEILRDVRNYTDVHTMPHLEDE